MKLIIGLILVAFAINVKAEDLNYASNRCQHMDGLTRAQRLIDYVVRDFKKLQTKCCNESVTQACSSAMAYVACKALASASFNEAACPEPCKTWAQDCAGYVSLSNREVKNKIEEEHGILETGE